MRSSSNGLLRGEVSLASAGGFSSWTPEIVVDEPLTQMSAPEIQDAIEAAVSDAQEAARVALAVREAELRRETASQVEIASREAYSRGFDDGREEGEKAEGARLRTSTLATVEALEEIRSGEVRWTGTIEENICALSTVIARQILGRELALDIEPVGELVRSALAEFPIDQPIRIRINPSDLNALSSVGAVESDPLQAIAADRDARWLPDASIAPGGCVVEGRERIIDGRIDTALERVYRRLTYTNV